MTKVLRVSGAPDLKVESGVERSFPLRTSHASRADTGQSELCVLDINTSVPALNESVLDCFK